MAPYIFGYLSVTGVQHGVEEQSDRPGDIIVESQGARLTVGSESAKHLNGSELDYSNNLQNAGFKVTNPNATKTCSCGESFSAC
tara:strand:- start:1295 stop:1546 length:252 start_codon:yes stop_codon:yes gene_type:complete